MTHWPHLLDALEERTRQLAARLDAGDLRDLRVPDVDLTAEGPLPAALAVRARVLLAETERLSADLARRTGPAARAAATYASH